MNVNFSSPRNAGLLSHLAAAAKKPDAVSIARESASSSPESIRDPYSTLGTHPDLVSWLWDELTQKLPKRCRWIVHGAPVLVRPESGIIFGFAGGTHTYAIRLPPEIRIAALKAGATTVWNYPAYPHLNIAASALDLSTIGTEWVFGGWKAEEKDWCLAAFEFAGGAD